MGFVVAAVVVVAIICGVDGDGDGDGYSVVGIQLCLSYEHTFLGAQGYLPVRDDTNASRHNLLRDGIHSN